MSAAHIPEGVTLFNPFDLMDEGIPWDGLIGRKNGLCQFRSSILGIRAGMVDARSKVYHDGLDTPIKFINVFAPPIVAGKVANNTKAYIAFMCGKIGIGPNDRIDLSTTGKLMNWSLACNEQEVGLDLVTKVPWFPMSDYQAAANIVFGLS